MPKTTSAKPINTPSLLEFTILAQWRNVEKWREKCCMEFLKRIIN